MCISQTKNADYLLMIKKNKYGQYFTIEAIAEFILLHDYGIHKIFLKRSKTILPTFFFTIISSLKLLM